MNRIFLSLLGIVFLGNLYAQDKPVIFKVDVSTDSILMNNYFEVRFTVENANGQDFEAPDFTEAFTIVSGPNYSTSMQVINGDISRQMVITYQLQPKEIGAYYIQPASVMADGALMETAPIEVFVHPNPDGIQQTPPMNGRFHMEFADPFGGESPFDEFFKGFDQQMMPFNFDQFFSNPDQEAMPFSMDDFLKEFENGATPEDLQKWFKQFDMEVPEHLIPAPGEEGQPKKKKRKTTRI